MKRVPASRPAESHEDWLIEQLKDSELCADYLNAALEEGDQAAFMLALRNVAKARGGVAAIAREAGMNRVSLNRALSEGGNPELRSLTRILAASGLSLVVASRPNAAPVRRRARRTTSRKSSRIAARV